MSATVVRFPSPPAERLRRAGAGIAWRLLAGIGIVLALALAVLLPQQITPPRAAAIGLCVLLVVWAIRQHERQAHVTPAERASLRSGLEGEQRVARVLERGLPREYTLLNNVPLPGAPGDLDHVVVGPGGVFVLETKNGGGRISLGADGTWRRWKTGRRGGVYEAPIGDPAAQLRRNVAALRTYLAGLGLDARVEGLLVFAHPDVRLEVPAGCTAVVRPRQALERIGSGSQRVAPVLTPREVEWLIGALVGAGRQAQVPLRAPAQALVEAALVVPLLLLVGFGVLGAGRVTRAQMGVIATAREAARVGALASSAPEAAAQGAEHARAVAAGYGLANGSLAVLVDASAFGRGGQVRAETRYTVTLEDLPLLGWARLPLASSHVEPVDRYRSLPLPPGGAR